LSPTWTPVSTSCSPVPLRARAPNGSTGSTGSTRPTVQ